MGYVKREHLRELLGLLSWFSCVTKITAVWQAHDSKNIPNSWLSSCNSLSFEHKMTFILHLGIKLAGHLATMGRTEEELVTPEELLRVTVTWTSFSGTCIFFGQEST